MVLWGLATKGQISSQPVAGGRLTFIPGVLALTRLMLADNHSKKASNCKPLSCLAPRLPLNVLAVDDNPANLKLITAMLDDLVQEVHSCQNGRQAVELAQRMEFDLIFMDIQMPILDGISATQTIRQEGCNQQTPIIAVTAFAYPEDMRRILASGFNGCLPKPVSADNLKRKISEFCRDTEA